MAIRSLAVAVSALSFTAMAHAACPSDLDVALAAARYANLQPAPNPPTDLSEAGAACARDKLVRFLGQQDLGRGVGYKAGLTNAAVQKRFGAMKVRLLDQDGRELDAGGGAAILGQPLNAVLWLVDDLKAVYEGLPGTPSVSVRFR